MTHNTSPLEQRKRFARFARQLEKGIPPTREQTEWLIETFKALSDAESKAEEVLGIKYGRGQGLSKEEALCKMDFIMHWIAGATSSDTSHLFDPKDALPPLGIEVAFDQASVIAKELFREDPSSESYDREYIKKCWYDKTKNYRQSLNRDENSPNTYYDF